MLNKLSESSRVHLTSCGFEMSQPTKYVFIDSFKCKFTCRLSLYNISAYLNSTHPLTLNGHETS